MKTLTLKIVPFFVLMNTICCAQKTEIVVIGNIHQPVANYNSDTLLNILSKIHPDFLLQELDSSSFTPEFNFKEKPTENEGMASVKYIASYPGTQMRPFDFEGRNEYRRNIGSRPTDGLSTDLLDSLYSKNALTKSQKKIYQQYTKLLEPLKMAASKAPKDFNNPINDEICKARQHCQYKELLKIMKQQPVFANRFCTKPNGEKISFKDGYELASKFWDKRNQTMAKNILAIARDNPGKRIVVLTGFMHRYYILSELNKSLKDSKSIEIKEFYDY